MSILERFLNYVKVDTMSSEESDTIPSTKKQLNLAKELIFELKELGLKDASIDKYGIVMATLEKNTDANCDPIGFIAHLDTIPGFSGTDVKPKVVKNYDGGKIRLNDKMVLDPEMFPFMHDLLGKTLITTDGTTVLGADDKAGIADIMGMLEYFYNHKEVKHTTIKVAFTPDEEIGGVMKYFDIEKFGAKYAYTVDGGKPNIISYECFNAASVKIDIKGLDIHPGSAKGKMINAIDIATEFNQLLPQKAKPMYTDGYQGFNHLCSLSGEVGSAKMEYIIRNFFKKDLEKQKKTFIKLEEKLNKKYGNVISLQIKDSYQNMADIIKKNKESINRAEKAMKSLGIIMEKEPIRGGTDGATLTLRGLNTPNLGTGGYNCHGPYEFACLEEMIIVSNILVEIAKVD